MMSQICFKLIQWEWKDSVLVFTMILLIFNLSGQERASQDITKVLISFEDMTSQIQATKENYLEEIFY